MTESSREKLLEAILHSYLQAVDAGQKPDRDALLQRHPEIADELRAFFADQSRMDRLAKSLKTAAYLTSSRSQPAFQAPTPAELADKFPQLEILELLGQGGMGAVYKARQKGLDRDVALKILPPDAGGNASFAERFSREAKALAKLSHPNIVTVFEFGQTSDGLCYFVMEYIDGVNLRQAMRAGNMSPKEALAIVPQICDALQFAHDEGIVHRDIKPENVLLDKKGRVKIADFGLAKLIGGSEMDASLTGTQQVMGTLRYMAPEQMEGSKLVDHRADIYSLGVVFYELLTGEVPMGRFAAPSKKVQIDVRLDEVVMRALEREPEQRWQQASDVKTEMAAITSSVDAGSKHAAEPSQKELEAQIVELLRQDKLAAAIKHFADIKRVSLGKAREAVTTIGNLHGIESANSLTRRFAGQIAILSLALAVFAGWLSQRENPGLLEGVAFAGAMIVYLGWLAGIWIAVRRGRQRQTSEVLEAPQTSQWSVVGVVFLVTSAGLVGHFWLWHYHDFWLPPGPSLIAFVVVNELMVIWASIRSVGTGLLPPERRVRGLALAMLVFGGLGCALGFAVGVFVGMVMLVGHEPPHTMPIRLAVLIFSIVCFVSRLLTLFAGIKLLGSGSRGLGIASSVLMLLPTDPLALVGIPLGLWALLTLLREDVSSAFSQRDSATNGGKAPESSPSKLVGTPLKNVRFLADESCDVGKQASFHFSAQGYRMIEQSPGRWTFERGHWLAGLWATDIRDLYTRLTVQTISAPEQKQWISCDWSVKAWQAIITRKDLRQFDDEGDGFRVLLGGVAPVTEKEAEKQANERFLWRHPLKSCVFWSILCVVLFVWLWFPSFAPPGKELPSFVGMIDRSYWNHTGVSESRITLEPRLPIYEKLEIHERAEVARKGFQDAIVHVGGDRRPELNELTYTLELFPVRGKKRTLTVNAREDRWESPGSVQRDGTGFNSGIVQEWLYRAQQGTDVPMVDKVIDAHARAIVEIVQRASKREPTSLRDRGYVHSDSSRYGYTRGIAIYKSGLDFAVSSVVEKMKQREEPSPFRDWEAFPERTTWESEPILYVGVPVMLAIWLVGFLAIYLMSREQSATSQHT